MMEGNVRLIKKMKTGVEAEKKRTLLNHVRYLKKMMAITLQN